MSRPTSLVGQRTRRATHSRRRRFGKDQMHPVCLPHTYAQRHADPECPSTSWPTYLITETSTSPQYYRIGEDRRRDAVDRVTALSSTGTATESGVRPSAAGIRTRPLPVGEVRRSLRRFTANPPTCKPADGCTARSGSAASAAITSATDVSFCPTSPPTIDDLLRTREPPHAAIAVSMVGPVDATQRTRDTRIRRLINRVKGDNDRTDAANGPASTKGQRNPQTPRRVPGHPTTATATSNHQKGRGMTRQPTNSRAHSRGNEQRAGGRLSSTRERVTCVLEQACPRHRDSVLASPAPRSTRSSFTAPRSARKITLPSHPPARAGDRPVVTEPRCSRSAAAHERAVRLNTGSSPRETTVRSAR